MNLRDSFPVFCEKHSWAFISVYSFFLITTVLFAFQDIRELQLTENPSYGEADDRTAKTAGANYGDKSRSKWIW